MINERRILCMRVESVKPTKNGGWLHPIESVGPIALPPVKPKYNGAAVNCEALLKKWMARPDAFSDLEVLAKILGVSVQQLHLIGSAWAPEFDAWAMAFRNGVMKIIGLQLRKSNGDKKTMFGTHNGIFAVPWWRGQEPMVVCEGGSDTAAALAIDLWAVGRPSCSGGNDYIIEYAKRMRVRSVVIVADADGPGLEGAEILSKRIAVKNCIVALPTKDMRDFVKSGGNRQTFQSIVSQYVWRK
jgi:hypothetical protein